MADTELKPCPFCGGSAQYHAKPVPKMQCSRCQAKIEGAKFRVIPKNYEEYLGGLWNRRQPSEEPKNL